MITTGILVARPHEIERIINGTVVTQIWTASVVIVNQPIPAQADTACQACGGS